MRIADAKRVTASYPASSLGDMRLPPKPAHCHLFGYSGDFSLMINQNNDGAVSLASELDPRAQAAARKMNGFNENHGGILSCPAVSQAVNTILSNSEVQTSWEKKKRVTIFFK